MAGDIGRLHHELLILQDADVNVPESACCNSMDADTDLYCSANSESDQHSTCGKLWSG
jgi:hypothetical protein